MTPHDRQEFALVMLGIGEAFGEAVSEARMQLYFAALVDLDIAAISAAALAHVRSSRFFPRPAEIREAIQGNLEDQAELAWGGLLRLVRSVGWCGKPVWPDEAMKRAAMELYGGWRSLCEHLPEQGPGLAVAAKQFKATYAAHARADRNATSLSAATQNTLAAAASVMTDAVATQIAKPGGKRI